MKIKITLLLSAFFALSLSAQQQRTALDKGLSFEMPVMAKKSAMAIDTLVPYPAACDSAYDPVGAVGGGYVMGTNSYGDLEKAQFFPNAGNGGVTELLVFFRKKEVVGSANDVSVKIYDGTKTSGPANVIATSDPVSLTNVDTTGFTSFTFSSPAIYSGEFYASIEVNVGDDTVGIAHTGTGCLSNAWEMWSDNSWNNVDTAWGDMDISMIVYAVVDDQAVNLNENFISATGLNIFPNPADKEITVRFEEALTEDANIIMKSVEGKSASATSISLDPGNTDYNIPVESLSPGAYVLEAQSGERFYRKVFIKK